MIAERTDPLLGRLIRNVAAPVKTLLLASVVLFLLGVIALLFSRGKTVVVTTNAPEAQVRVDGELGNQVDATTWRFQRIPYGSRHLMASHRDFVTRQDALDVGLFSGGQRQVELERRKIRLTLNTSPGAEVILDGKTIGRANDSGVFSSDQILAGDYQLTVRLPGYQEWRFDAGLHNETVSLRAGLRMTEEKRTEIARQRDQAYELMQESAALFGRRNYRAALEVIERSIKLNPDDYRALQLRDRIVETLKILQ